MSYLTVEGTVKGGTLKLGGIIPAELSHLDEWDSPEFQGFDGSYITCTLRASQNRNGLSLEVIPNSIVIQEEKMVGQWSKIGGAWFSPHEREVFDTAYHLANNGVGTCNIFGIGPSGYGKTYRPMGYAQHTDSNFTYVNVALYEEGMELFGTPGLSNDTTDFYLTPLAQCIQQDNTFVVLDELSRATASVQNVLMPLLDFRKEVTLTTPRGEIQLRVGHGVVFVATANIGRQYVGTDQLDYALVNRFHMHFIVGAPPAEVEKEMLRDQTSAKVGDINLIIRALNNIRKDVEVQENDTEASIQKKINIGMDISTRKARQIAELSTVLDVDQAFYHSLIVLSKTLDIKKFLMDRIREIL